jgi:hypothetical protein
MVQVANNKSLAVVRSESVRNIIRERRMLEHVNHPFICNLRYSFQDIEYMYAHRSNHTLRIPCLSRAQVPRCRSDERRRSAFPHLQKDLHRGGCPVLDLRARLCSAVHPRSGHHPPGCQARQRPTRRRWPCPLDRLCTPISTPIHPPASPLTERVERCLGRYPRQDPD